MVNFDPIYCPQCKLGFAPETELCPSCKIALVPADELEELEMPFPFQDDLANFEQLRVATAGWIQHLQEKLEEAEISYRTKTTNYDRTLLAVYVRPEDLKRAKKIDHEVFAAEVPGSGDVLPVEKLDFWSCPACGHQLAENDQKCGECGLALFPTEGWTCSSCKGEIEVDMKVCPHCGESIEWDEV